MKLQFLDEPKFYDLCVEFRAAPADQYPVSEIMALKQHIRDEVAKELETGLTKTLREQAERLEASVGARRRILDENG